MKMIVITSPDKISGEAFAIGQLLDRGIDTIHIRKPDWDESQCRKLIEEIPEYYRHKLVVHQYFELCTEYHLQGIHLNKRHPFIPPHTEGTISCSCHSFEEVVHQKPTMNYVFLSPIFNSISKQGYLSNFSLASLREAQAEGIINEKVIALGGVTSNKQPLLESLGFGGMAMLGEIWNNYPSHTT